MTHPLLRKLAALAEEDGLGDISQLLGTPGRSTLTSKLPPRAAEAAPIVINVADAESARTLGDTILVAARSKFQRAASGPAEQAGEAIVDPATNPVASAPATRATLRPQVKPATRRPVDKARLQAEHKAALGDAVPMNRRPDGTVRLERTDDAPRSTTIPGGERHAFKAAADEPAKVREPVEDPFAMHLLPAFGPADTGAARGVSPAANPIAGVDPVFMPQATEETSGTKPASGREGWAFEDMFERESFAGAGEAPTAKTDAKESEEVEQADAPDHAFHAAAAEPASPRKPSLIQRAPGVRAAKPDDAPAFRAAKPDDAPAFRAAKPDDAPAFRAAKPDDAPVFRAAVPDAAAPGVAKPDDAPAFRAAKAKDAPDFRAASVGDAPARRLRTNDEPKPGADADSGGKEARATDGRGNYAKANSAPAGKTAPSDDDTSSPLDPYFDRDTPFSGPSAGPAPSGPAPAPGRAPAPGPAPAKSAPAGPAPGGGGSGPADLEAQKQAVKQQAERKRAEVTEVHQHTAATASAQAQTERQTTFDAAKAEAQAEKARLDGERDAAKAEAAAERDSKEVTRAGLEEEIATAETQEVAELTSGKDSAVQELEATLDNQKARLTTEHEALMAKVDAELATSEQESVTKLGEKTEALRTNMEADLTQLATSNETRKAKNVATAESERDAFLEEGRGQEKDARERGETDAAAVKDAAEVDATAAIEEAKTRGLAAQNAALAAAEQITDPAEKEKKKGTAVLAFNEALLAGTNKAIQLRTQAAVSADTIRTKAMALADGMRTKAEEKAKSLVSDAKQLNTTLDTELAREKDSAKVKLTSALAALEGERQTMLAQLRSGAATQRTTATTKLAADTATIDADRASAVTDLEATLATDLAAATDKAAKARADLASHSESDLAAAADEVRKATAAIDQASEDAEKRNGETVAKVEATVTARTTAGIADMQRVAAETLISIDVEADAMVRSLDERGKMMLAQQDAAAKATEEGLAKRQLEIEKDLAKQTEIRKGEIGKEAIAEQEKLREAKLDGLDETYKALDGELDHALDPNRDREAEAEATKAQKAEADKLAAQMEDALDDTFVDEDAVLDMMSGKTPAQVAAMKAAYKEKTGKDLDTDLGGAMDDDEMKMAKAQMSGDKLTQRLARLEYESEEWLTDESKMAAAMDGLTADEKTELAKRFEQRTGDDLATTLDDELDADQRAKVGEVKDGQESYGNADTEDGRKAAEKLGKAKLAELRKGDKKLTDEQDKAAAKAAADIRAGMTQLIGTDEDAILDALKGKSPEEIAAIKAHFAAQGWGDMESSMEESMGGLLDSADDMKLAKARLSGDPVVAAAAQLEVAMDGAGTDTDAVHEALEGITDPEQRRKVAQEYESRTGCKLDDDVKGELSGHDASLAEAMMIDDPVKRASAIAANRLDEAANGNFISDATGVRVPSILIGGVTAHSAFTDEKKMYAELEKIKDPAVRKQLEQDYEELTGKSLRTDLADSLGGSEDNARYDAVEAYLDGDMDAARAARIRAGADSPWGTDEQEIYSQLEGLSPDERKRLQAKLVDQTRSDDQPDGLTLDNILEDELSDEQLDKGKELAKDGKVSDATAIRNALEGLGTDDEGLRKALAGKSKAEIDAIAKDYNARYGKDGDGFVDDILGENLGGREDKLLALQLEKGEPQTDAEKIERIKALHEIERGNGNMITDWARGDAGKDMDRQLEAAKELEKKLNNGTLSEDDKEALTDVTNYHSNSIGNYRKAQEDVVSVMNTASDFAYGANPIVAAMQRISNKRMVMEDNYGAGEIIKDVGVEVAKMGVQALTAMVGGGQLMQGIGGLGKEVLMGAFKGMLEGVVEGAFDEAAIRDLGDYVKGLLSKGATGAAKGAAEALTEAAIEGAVGKLMSQFSPNTEGKARLLGALEELLKGAGGVAADADTYNKRWEDTAKSAVPGIIESMVAGQQKGADAYNKSLTKEFGDAARNRPYESEETREKAVQNAIAEGERFDALVEQEAAQAEANARMRARAEGKSPAEEERDAAWARRATEEAQKARARTRHSNQSEDVLPEPPPPTAPEPPAAPAAPERDPLDPAPTETDEMFERARKAREQAIADGASPEDADRIEVEEMIKPPKTPPGEPIPDETDVKFNRAQRAHDEVLAGGGTQAEADQAFHDTWLYQ